MADITMQLHIEADADTVYAAISTTEGIHGWFTTTATADQDVDGLHELRFPGVPEPWRLRITHSGFAAVDDAYRDFSYGWATKFTQLKAYAETGKPAPFFTG
ncbi:hypothetical protein [Streptomyces sp. NPDC050704]|uniref:hypothetical protein n=1 Tax=Streptomyces sp. NPDC050704 TaxID=3157219 RepID=UPI0034316C34